MLRRPWMKPMRAWAASTRKSHATASSAPPPSASPLSTEIARDRKLGATAERIAVERCHYRQRETPDRLERRPRLCHHAGCLLSRAHAAEVAQIAAGGETLVSGTAKNRGQQACIVAGCGEGFAQLIEHGAAERIALLRAVDSDTQHTVAHFRQEQTRPIHYSPCPDESACRAACSCCT